MTGNYTQAQASLELTMADSRNKGLGLDEARCLSYLGLIARRQGNYEQAKSWYQQALALLQPGPNQTELETGAIIQVCVMGWEWSTGSKAILTMPGHGTNRRLP